jgi:hypothetical protein
VGLVGNGDHGALGAADGTSSTLEVASVNSAVGVDGSSQSSVEAVCLNSEVSGTALDAVNQAEGNGVDDALDLAEDSGDGLTDDRHSVEQTGFADEDVEQNLVDTDELELGQYRGSLGKCGKMAYLAESVVDGISISLVGDWSITLHLRNGGSDSADDVGEPGDDLRERALTDNDERTVDDGDGLSWGLQRLRLLSHHLDVGDDLSRSERSKSRCGASSSCEDDVAERNHFDDEASENLKECLIGD